jgi:hypothetical protein
MAGLAGIAVGTQAPKGTAGRAAACMRHLARALAAGVGDPHQAYRDDDDPDQQGKDRQEGDGSQQEHGYHQAKD